MTMILPFAGLMANWMLEPPVSTPTRRMMRSPQIAHPLIFTVGQRERSARR